MMKHFASSEWLDLARGVAAPEVASAMQDHLEHGCNACAEVSSEMSRLVTLAKREAQYEPSADSVRVAKALLATQRITSSSRPESHFVKLVFDSLTQPLVAGVRGANAARQLLYQENNCCIDIRLESKAGKRMELVGQVLDSGAIGRGLDQIPVSLQKNDQVFAQTLTNHFGEFRFLVEDIRNVQMVVDVTVDRRLVVPLPD